MDLRRKPTKIFIISGPSGTGGDSVIEGLEKTGRFSRVITTVTRPRRPVEREGKPYYFVTVPQFKRLIADDVFIEWAIVYGDYRGCTKAEIKRLLAGRKPIIWKVDWQGVQTIKRLLPRTIAIFIAPPSFSVLEERLKQRGQDSPQTIKERKKFSQEWLTHTDLYDYTAVNEQGHLDQTIAQVEAIIAKELES
ncbi:MAG: guanylate kinase [Candidatus Buchananbacteria bacterium RIFCSPHIGHO2_02_FULL_56_16]|uniref:Guanylate kinase n=1 Tax=Candidatus Buchananbacteria bacterium RIFCSPHIGHO2_02_FULL_56_16 TaxID=1797542 RepID=A0A1G1YFG2_9BACT|nr:MAG: guanylate kinase [Candidatus Buchananbacteria bacterium RIFCSPHIGHO2_02_FULL_56_16]